MISLPIRKHITAAALSVGLLCTSLGAASVTSRTPGNIFTDTETARFTVNASGALSYECRDFWGNTVASGKIERRSESLQLPLLPPGWYELHFDPSANIPPVSFGVLIDRSNKPLPAHGRVAVDAASSWLVTDPSHRAPLAAMMRMAGIPWVRERISWRDTEPAKGVYDWSAYQSTMDAFEKEGVLVDQVWHDAPKWTHTDRPQSTTPSDLRDVYNWLREGSRHFSGSINAWEIWNEMDLPNFWSDTGDRYAALLKACYWAIQDGNPEAIVVLGSLATIPPKAFAANIYESGIQSYYDVFNWHIYTVPVSYADSWDEHRKLQLAYGEPAKPAWLTEAGILISGTQGEDKSLLEAEGWSTQTRYVPQSITMSLATGSQRHFFFVLPHYLENGVQFGILRPDLSPNPALVALSASANILGESQELGSYPLGEGILAEGFSTPAGDVLVVWAERPTTFRMPVTRSSAEVADIFGARRQVRAPDGYLTLEAGPEAIYIFTPLPELAAAAKAKTPPAPKADASPPPSRVVLSGWLPLPCSKANNTYRLDSTDASAIPFYVDVYNFDAKKTHSGTVSLELPEGWRASPQSQSSSIEPMGRATLRFEIEPADKDNIQIRSITVRGDFTGEHVAPSVSYLQSDPSGLKPERALALDWLPASRWATNVTDIGTVTTTDIPDGLHIEARFSGSGDRWAYPELNLGEQLDLSDFDGISFDLEAIAPTPNSWMRLMVVEDNGAAYMGGTQDFSRKQRVTILFKDMIWMGFSQTDPDGHFSPDKITTVRLGLNTPGDYMEIKVTNLEAVKFAD